MRTPLLMLAGIGAMAIILGCSGKSPPSSEKKASSSGFHFVTLQWKTHVGYDQMHMPLLARYALVECADDDLPGDHLIFLGEDGRGGFGVCRATLLSPPKPTTRISDPPVLNYRLDHRETLMPEPILAVNTKAADRIECVFVNCRQVALNLSTRDANSDKVMKKEELALLSAYLTPQASENQVNFSIIRAGDLNQDGISDYAALPEYVQGNWEQASLVLLLSDGTPDRRRLVPVPKDELPARGVYDFGILRINGTVLVYLYGTYPEGHDQPGRLGVVAYLLNGSGFHPSFRQGL